MNKLTLLTDDDIRAMIDESKVLCHRARGLNPNAPVLRGTAQNPDVYFQGRETVNPYYQATPGIVQDCMNRFAELTGRRRSDKIFVNDVERIHRHLGEQDIKLTRT